MENNTGNITSNLKEGKVEDEFRVKQVNRTFLATVLVSVLASAAILLICYGVGKILNASFAFCTSRNFHRLQQSIFF